MRQGKGFCTAAPTLGSLLPAVVRDTLGRAIAGCVLDLECLHFKQYQSASAEAMAAAAGPSLKKMIGSRSVQWCSPDSADYRLVEEYHDVLQSEKRNYLTASKVFFNLNGLV